MSLRTPSVSRLGLQRDSLALQVLTVVRCSGVSTIRAAGPNGRRADFRSASKPPGALIDYMQPKVRIESARQRAVAMTRTVPFFEMPNAGGDAK